MKIVNKVLISVSESDIKEGKFVNETVIEISNDCFNSLRSLRSVSLPKVTTAGSYCFSYCAALTEINLPALTTAGSDCFSSNDALTEINLPALTKAVELLPILKRNDAYGLDRFQSLITF